MINEFGWEQVAIVSLNNEVFVNVSYDLKKVHSNSCFLTFGCEKLWKN